MGVRAAGPAGRERRPGREPGGQRQQQRGAGGSKQRQAQRGHEPAGLGGPERAVAEAMRAAGPGA